MQNLTFYSIVKEDLLKKTLFIGTFKAVLGLILILIGGILLPPSILVYVGPFLFIVGMGLIGWGLIPYRKLKKMQNFPNTISVTPDALLIDLNKKKARLIPLSTIKKIEYIDQNPFGILIFTGDHTFFAPFFSKRIFNEISEIIEENNAAIED